MSRRASSHLLWAIALRQTMAAMMSRVEDSAATTSCLPALPYYTPEFYALGCSFVNPYTGTSTTTIWEEAGGETTAETCAALCGQSMFNLAGMVRGDMCLCMTGEGITIIPTDDSACNLPCVGNSTQTCGGSDVLNVINITNPATSLEQYRDATLPDCTRDPLCSTPICNISLTPQERVAGFIANLTLEEKLNNLDAGAAGVPRLGLPPYGWWNEGLHGVSKDGVAMFNLTPGANWSYATSFPMPILTGAAFDDDLVYQIGQTVGKEGRAFANAKKTGYDFWTPNVNPFKDPRWGRGPETPGEDPVRMQNYAYNLVQGLQGGIDPEEKQIMATCKHYAVYDVEQGREEYDYNPTTQELFEYYLAPFKTCARDAKVGAVMCSYNSVSGTPSCANRYLLQTVLREHWGWSDPSNWVTSDCAAITDIEDRHNYTSTAPDTAAVALNAGTDLACEFDAIYRSLADSLAEDTVTEAAIDQALSRLWTALFGIGYFNHTGAQYAYLQWSDVGTPEAQYLAYAAAAEGMTLLKNDGTLPLPQDVSNVAVIGPWGNATAQLQGSYFGWAPYLISPLAGMQSRWSNVQFALGTDIDTNDTSGFAEAISLASEADYIIYCGGIDTTIEAESLDRTSITWPGNQLDLIGQLGALGKPLVVVQFGGGQLDDISLLLNDDVNSLLWAGYPGQEAGNALSDVLDGTRAVAGRLPITQYPANYTDEVSILNPGLRPNATTGNPGRTYMWYSTPVLPFGYGLHYTNFTLEFDQVPYSTYDISTLLKSAQGIVERTPFFEVTAKVTNDGGPANAISDFSGLLFISGDAGPQPAPRKTLVAYDRAHNVSVGETQTLRLSLTLSSLARTELNGSSTIYPGTYTLILGVEDPKTFNFTLTGDVTVIEAVPLAVASPVPISYRGCYSPEDLSNGTPLTLDDLNSPQSCGNGCHDAGFLYALLKNGSECICSTSLPTSASPVDDSHCSSPCIGNAEEFCGGNGFANVYKVVPNATLQPPTWSP